MVRQRLLALVVLGAFCAAGCSSASGSAPGREAADASESSVPSGSETSTSGGEPRGEGDQKQTSTAAAGTLAPTTAASIVRGTPEQWAAFDDSLRQALLGRGDFTVQVAVAHRGVLVHEAAYGIADPPDGTTPATPDMRFRIGSISKSVLAPVVLQLVDEGRLGLDEAVLTRLANRVGVSLGDPRMASVTVRQLLSHTSSLPEYWKTFFRTDGTCRDAAARGLSRRLMADPGTLYNYSNLNYCLLGLLVEDVTGRSFEVEVQDRVLTPLGVSDMRVAKTNEVRPGDVVHPAGPDRSFLEMLGAAGAWVGRARDVVKVLDGMDAGTVDKPVVPASLVGPMRQRLPFEYPNPQRWYGLGVMVWSDGSYGHTGTVENARSMGVHRSDGVTWAVLVNGNAPSETDRIESFVERALREVPGLSR
ncbi:MAG TPA: serine hydrolase domain-containing protein [Acidimicrobiales bacterium]